MSLSSEVFELLTRNGTPSSAPGGFLRLYTLRDGELYTIDENGVIRHLAYVDGLTDGTVSAPGLYWTADTNTGLWRPGSGIVGVTGDGLEVVRFQAPTGANPQALFANGSLTAPAIGWASRAGGLFSISTTSTGLTFDLSTSYIAFTRATGTTYAIEMQGSVAGAIGLRAPVLGSAIFLSSRISNGTTSPGLTIDQAVGTAFSAASAGQSHITVNSTVNQSSTAGFTQLRLNQTQTALGSGAQYYFETQVGGVTNFAIDSSVAGAGAVLHSAGTAARPSISFISQQNAGFHLIASTTIGVNFSGATYWSISSASFVSYTSMVLTSNNAAVTGAAGTNPNLTIIGAVAYTGANVAQRNTVISSTLNQTGTSSFTALDITRTETALGSGPQYAINVKGGVAGTTQTYSVSNSGGVANTAVSPATLAAGNIDDYAGIGQYGFARLTPDAGGTSVIRGILATNVPDGREVVIVNIGAANLTVNNQDAGSTAANRIITLTNTAVIVAAGGVFKIKYDLTTQRWRQI